MQSKEELYNLADSLLNGTDYEKTTNNDNRPLTDDEVMSFIQEQISYVETTSWSALRQQQISSTFQFTHILNNTLRASSGRSNVVLNMTGPCIDTLSTYMTNTFCSQKEAVRFIPSSDEVRPMAEQAAKMVNAVIHKHNPGYKVFSRCFKDAAINKNSVLKVTWNEDRKWFDEVFEDIEQDQLSVIMEQKENDGYSCEVTEVVEVETDNGPSSRTTLRCYYDTNLPLIECIPPEEFLINEGATDINDSKKTRFVAHRQLLYSSDIQKMFPEADTSDLPSSSILQFDYQTQARHAFDGTYNQFIDNSSQQATELKELVESWILVDRNGDGVAEWYHTFSVEHNLLSIEEWFGPIPFVSFCYFPVPHTFYGLSVYDKVSDLERSATALLRSEVDAAVIRNTPRVIADARMVNPSDLATVKTGVIRAAPGFTSASIHELTGAGSAGGAAGSVITILRDQVKAEIGIDPINGQVDTDISKSGNDYNKTVAAITNASAKVESYAREFADNTLRDLVWVVLQLLVQHSNDSSVIELANSVTPNEPFYLGQYGMQNAIQKADINATVGLGFMSGQQKVAASEKLLEVINNLAQDSVLHHSLFLPLLN